MSTRSTTRMKVIVLLVFGLTLAQRPGERSGHAQAAARQSEGDATFMLHYRRAMELVKQEDWDAAIGEFRRAYDARATPRPELHLYIGKAYLYQGNGSEALASYLRFMRESKSPSPSQLAEVRSGTKRAQELIELQTRRERLEAREQALGSRSVTAEPRRELSSRTDSARSGRVDDDDDTTSEPNRSAVAPHGDSTSAANQNVLVTGRNRDIAYTVTVGQDKTCTAPCKLSVPAGPALVTVTGPGTKQFRREVVFPSGPSTMAVQHLTLSRAIAGPLLVTLSIPFLVGGSLTLGSISRSSDLFSTVGLSSLGGFQLLHAAVFFFTGIGQMAAIKRSRIELQPLGTSVASRPTSLRLAGLDLAPSTSGKGVVAQALFRF